MMMMMTTTWLRLSFLLLLSFAFAVEGREILVGGKLHSWKLPSTSDHGSLNQWARRTRFKVGDVLVFSYEDKADSVLQVTKRDYKTCNTTNPIKESKDGWSKFELDHSGAFYFISGVVDYCIKKEKMVIVVLSEDHWKHNGSPLSAPVPAPTSSQHGGACGLNGGVFAMLMGLMSLVAFVFV